MISLPFSTNGYTFINELGRGGFSYVYRAVHDKTRKFVAIKVFEKKIQTSESLRAIKREIKIMKSLDHPFISSFFQTMEDDENIYVVMENAERGTLLQFINVQGKLPEKIARKLFYQIMLALDYLHNKMKIAHRDIKAENILLDKYFNVKIIDFGFSVKFGNEGDEKKKEKFTNNCGTPKYVAPEVVKREQVSERSDIWSAGIILYMMVFGKYPFNAGNINDLFTCILFHEPAFPEHTNVDIIDLVSHMLDKNPNARWSIEEILKSVWATKSKESFSLNTIIDNPKYFVEGNSITDSVIINAMPQDITDDEFDAYYRITKKSRIIFDVNQLLHPSSLTRDIKTISETKISCTKPFIQPTGSYKVGKAGRRCSFPYSIFSIK